MSPRKYVLLCSLILPIITACAQVQQITPPPAAQVPSMVPSATTLPSQTPLPTASPTPTEPAAFTLKSPLWIANAADLMNRLISVDPNDPQRLAYCAPGEIRTSLDGGLTWGSIPTTGVLEVIDPAGYVAFGDGTLGDHPTSPSCSAVALDPLFTQSFYAVFTTALEEYGAPPVFYMGLVTSDAGASWHFVPQPEGSTQESFGRFWVNGDGTVQALFHNTSAFEDPVNTTFVLGSQDGGQTWTPAGYTCPSSGVCMRWGPAPSMIPGMGSPLPQFALLSTDNGTSWSTLTPPVELRVAGPNQLVSFSGHEAAIISGSLPISSNEGGPLMYTQDGGLTWNSFSLPPLPAEAESPGYYPALQILPDGWLVAQNSSANTWYLLTPESPTWCILQDVGLPDFPTLLQPVNDSLWWVNYETQLAENLPLDSLLCPAE